MASFKLNNQEQLPPTQKLWRDNPYLTEGEATVLHTQDDLVILDRTVFYAESGGQVADKGFIEGVSVKDVQKQPGKVVFINRPDVNVPAVHTNTTVVHQLDHPSPFEVSQKVKMEINWDYRYKLMRYHSAAHFAYYAIEQIYGRQQKLYIKGCYIYDQRARFDYANKLDPELIGEVSTLVNDLIGQGGDILMESEPSTRDISYWRYGDIIIPCGGTHVKSAEEIGTVSLKRKNHGKKLNRIYLFLDETI